MSRLMLMNISVLLMMLSVFWLKHQRAHVSTIIVGTLIVAAGLGLSMWAQWALGRNWVGGIGLHKGHRLITTGPYRYVRHPLYSGMLLSAVGFGVLSLNPLFFVATLCFAISFITRVPGEERLLHGRFKQRYQRYAATTGMLFPRVRKRG